MKKILFLLLLPFLVACSSEILPESHGVEGSVASHEVSLENALKRVEPLFSSIGGKTRSGLKVSSVEYVTAPRRTRSNIDSVMYYLVNYGKETGFALLAADDRIYPVLAISADGNMVMEDTVSNPGLATFFREIGWNPPIIPDTLVKPDDPLYLIQLVNVVKPKLSQAVSKWDREEIAELVYNQYGYYTDKIKGTTLSTVQIMSHYGHPNAYQLKANYPYLRSMVNWDFVRYYPANSDENKPLINLFSNLDEDMDEYPLAIALPYTFREWGYESPHYSDPLDRLTWPNFGGSEYIADALDDGYLVQAFGEDTGGIICAWTIDGYMKYIYPTAIAPKDEDTVNLLHCVWGNGGRDNGYFFCRVNNPVDGFDIGAKPEKPDSQTTEDAEPRSAVEFYQYKYEPR